MASSRRKRLRGYYALPLLWRDHVIGWVNVCVKPGYVRGRAPRDAGFRTALYDEAARMADFLGLSESCVKHACEKA
jgi:uncharacterized protein